MGFGKTIFGPKGARWRCRRYARSIIVSAIKGPYHGLNSAGVILSAGRFQSDIWQPKFVDTHDFGGQKSIFFSIFPKMALMTLGHQKWFPGPLGVPNNRFPAKYHFSGRIRPIYQNLKNRDVCYFFDDFGIF